MPKQEKKSQIIFLVMLKNIPWKSLGISLQPLFAQLPPHCTPGCLKGFPPGHRRQLGLLLNVVCTFNLRPVIGVRVHTTTSKYHSSDMVWSCNLHQQLLSQMMTVISVCVWQTRNYFLITSAQVKTTFSNIKGTHWQKFKLHI